MNRTITVRGTGKISAQADEVILRMNLTARDRDYAAAARKAEAQAQALESALQGAAFPPSALKTADFNVNTEYENVKGEDGVFRNVCKGFVCCRRLEMRFPFAQDRLSAALQALSACNALPEISLSFTVSDRDALRRQALQAAAKNAREEAEILCDAAGVRLGGLLEIRHEQGGRAPLSPTRFAADDARMFAAPARAAIRPEEVEIEDGASFTWEIE